MDKKNIKTSVVIPVYNTERYLEECIESVLKQTQKEIEIILVDDGSTDGSAQIIKEYEERYPFVKAIYQENQKLGAARNTGIEAASGKYIYLLDSDDYISETLLDECYSIAEKEHLDFVMFDAESFPDGEDASLREKAAREEYDRSDIGIENRIYTGVEFWEEFYLKRAVFPNAYLVYINAEFLKKHNLFFEPGVYYEDNDWMVRMYLYAESIAYIPQQLYYRRFRVGSIMTVNYNDIHLKSCIILGRKMMQMLLDAQSETEQSMIAPVLGMLLNRFKEIFKAYCKEKRLYNDWSEVLEFYKYMNQIYASMDEKDKMLGIAIMAVADILETGLRELGLEVNVTEADFEEYKKQLVFEEFQNYPLYKKDMKVGIYGTGAVCTEFLLLYRQYVSDISCSLFFVDTYKESGGSYKGYPLYNIKDIGKMEPDIIIIASSRYREAMRKNIQAHLNKDTEILNVPEFVRYFV